MFLKGALRKQNKSIVFVSTTPNMEKRFGGTILEILFGETVHSSMRQYVKDNSKYCVTQETLGGFVFAMSSKYGNTILKTHVEHFVRTEQSKNQKMTFMYPENIFLSPPFWLLFLGLSAYQVHLPVMLQLNLKSS